MIDPKDVMRRYSIEELCETADEYYRRIDDPSPLMSKPFAFLHETPEMLQNLGLLLSGLQLGRTMTVLDFGAGTCWLSRILTQLNCQAICCDTSRAALAIGRRLFDEYPLIGTVVFRPKFLWFDGRTLDLPDHSVDRIVSFDAFHHVPNPGDVIAEFGRVLKPGGLAGFSEPGPEHSRTPQSQYEMQNHRVLENDIDVHEIFALAQAAGFTELTLKAINDMSMSLGDYAVLRGRDGPEAAERLRTEIWNQTHNTMHNRTVFFLHKGVPARDSRSHIGLAHAMTVARSAVVLPPGASLQLSFRIANTGVAAWIEAHSEIFGTVRLGSHLYDGSGRLVDVDFSRHPLPRRVDPGETIDLAITVSVPAEGDYRLAFDLVSEGVTWFENVGSKPVYVDVKRSGA